MQTHWMVVLLPPVLLYQLAAGAEWSFNADDSQLNLQQVQDEEAAGYPEQEGIQRFQCPAGFFRLKKYCYYLSAGTAFWRDAYFQCVARNATLAVLNRNGKDKTLRKYLMGDQFSRLERWIGGIYNWRQRIWEWGVTGDPVLFQNFANDTALANSREHDCMVVDPEIKYKWSARRCFQQKHFICEAPAGRIIGKSRRRKNINDPHAPQNQRLRLNGKDENKRRGELSRQHQQQRRRRKNGTLRSIRKKNWHRQREFDNQIWAHGIKPGSRPPKGLRRPRLHKKGKHSKRPRLGKKKTAQLEPRISQVTPKAAGDFGAFEANVIPIGPQALAEEQVLFPPSYDARSVFTNEEILVKT